MERAQISAQAMAKCLDVVKRRTLESNAVRMEDTDVWQQLCLNTYENKWFVEAEECKTLTVLLLLLLSLLFESL